jgi:hypothetical protein
VRRDLSEVVVERRARTSGTIQAPRIRGVLERVAQAPVRLLVDDRV